MMKKPEQVPILEAKDCLTRPLGEWANEAFLAHFVKFSQVVERELIWRLRHHVVLWFDAEEAARTWNETMYNLGYTEIEEIESDKDEWWE